MKALWERLRGLVSPGGAELDDESVWAGCAQGQPRPRLANPELDRHLDAQGYAVVEGFLDAGEVAALAALFHGETSALHAQPFASSIRSDDTGYKHRVSDGIGRVFAPKIARHLRGYRYCFAGFLVKAPGGEADAGQGTVPLHQDIAMMNEARYQGLGIWVPLSDTDARNGCLSVVPGSHLISHRLRWPGGPFAFRERQEALAEQAVDVPMAAGSAIVYCQKLVHGSAPNRSFHTRIVAGALAAPAEAPLLYFHHEPNDCALDVHAVDDRFYVSHTYGARPQGAPRIARVRKPAP